MVASIHHGSTLYFNKGTSLIVMNLFPSSLRTSAQSDRLGVSTSSADAVEAGDGGCCGCCGGVEEDAGGNYGHVSLLASMPLCVNVFVCL